MKKISMLVAVLFMFVAGFAMMSGESAAATKSDTETTAPQDAKIDINTADEATLSTLPGIGEKTAAAITSYRKENGNFKTIDDLEQVKGIGSKKLEKLRPFLKEI